MKKFVLGLVLLLFFTNVCAQNTSEGTHHFSLEDCLNYAFGNNLTRLNMLLTEDLREDTYQQAKKERLPSVSASASESFSYNNKSESSSFSGNYGLNANLTLYQGGSITNTIEQNKLSMEQSSYQTKQYENELAIQILQAFLNVLGNEELLNYQRTVLKSSEEQLNQGKAQYEVGTLLESDYLLLEAQFASDKSNIVDTEISRANSLLTLKSLLSMDPEVNLDIVYPDTNAIEYMTMIPEQDYVMERAMNTLPDLKISQYNVDLANVDVKIAKSGYLPTLSLSGGISTGHSKDFRNWGTQVANNLGENIGLTLSIPIFDKGKTKSRVNQSRIALQQAEYNKTQTDLNIRQTIIQEYQDVVSALNRYNSNSVKESAYSKTFEVYGEMFNAGSITAVELLQQQNNYISALNDYIQSKYSFMLRRKILDVYMGEQITM